MNDAKLELRAYGAMSVLIQSSNAFLEAAIKTHPAMKDLPPAKQGQALLVAMLTLLFDGQQFFWEHVISDKTIAARFEKFFYTVFYRITGVNPSRRLKDHRAYLEENGEGGRATYLGERIASDVTSGLDDGLAQQLNFIYGSVVKPYGGALAQIWEMPDAALAEAKTALETSRKGTLDS